MFCFLAVCIAEIYICVSRAVSNVLAVEALSSSRDSPELWAPIRSFSGTSARYRSAPDFSVKLQRDWGWLFRSLASPAPSARSCHWGCGDSSDLLGQQRSLSSKGEGASSPLYPQKTTKIRDVPLGQEKERVFWGIASKVNSFNIKNQALKS